MTGRSERGQSLAEFLVVAASVLVALFFPYLHGESVATALLRALMACFRARSFVISIL